jgi:tetratricopeptide (TPR) repeat protein
MPFGFGKGGDPGKGSLRQVVLDLICAPDLFASERIVVARPDVIGLRGQFEIAQVIVAARKQHRPDVEALLSMYQELLGRCKKVGTPAAFQEARAARSAKARPQSRIESITRIEQSPSLAGPTARASQVVVPSQPAPLPVPQRVRPPILPPPPGLTIRFNPPTFATPDIEKHVIRFIEAKDWTASREVLEAHPELLGEAAEEHIAGMLGAALTAGRGELVSTIDRHHALLARCREVGTGRAFSELPGRGAAPTTAPLSPAAPAPAAVPARSRRSSTAKQVSSPGAPAAGSWIPTRPAAGDREMRIFVSSTFRDMGAERDELVKRTFPALRKLCESRGVAWGEVDLRWGVTDEQKAEGQVLPICLAEIRGCRPYFIGLLGERYGWVPDAIDPDLALEEKWLDGAAGRSVTELEILHGVLNDPAMAEHTFFYLRDPAYVEGKPAQQFCEMATPEEIAELGPQKAKRRAADRKAKLQALKDRVERSGLPVRKDYPDPQALGELVLADISALIDRLYPEGSAPDPLTREASEHEAFATSRARVYIGRSAYSDQLDAHAAGDGPPLAVLGESGSGKSALLANWALAYRATHPDTVVLAHFIGASAASTDWTSMLRRLIGELNRQTGLALETPPDPEQLRVAFANALHMAATRGRVVLVLDALNQLEDRQGAFELLWLPPEIPSNVRLLVSTLPGQALASIEKRGWPTLRVEPLDTPERERLIVEYLGQYRKSLDPARSQRLAAALQCSNPLFLRALLEELRLWGEHETLDQRIEHYLSASSIDALYELILARYEADYERDRPRLVRDAFSLLWGARRGLSESELMELLGSGGNPLPRANWSPLYLAAEQALMRRAGLIGFFHDYLREAVRRRYLPSEEAQRAVHIRLADYFGARELGRRKIDEFPWQLAGGEAWPQLVDVLSNLEFLEAAWNLDRFEVMAFWARVESNSPFRMAEAYRSVLEAPAGHAPTQVSIAAGLLDATGHPEEALFLTKHLAQRFRETGDQANLQVSLAGQARILFHRGELDQAMALYKEQGRICRELGNNDGLQSSLSGEALIHQVRGELDTAMALHKEQGRLSRELGNMEGLQASLGNQAVILRARGELDAALEMLGEMERICREQGDWVHLALAFGHKGRILRDRGHLTEALALYREQARICRELGNKAGLAMSLNDQARVHCARGEPVDAMALYREQEAIYRELGDQDGLAASLGNQANIHADHGGQDMAMALLSEVERIYRGLGNRDGLQRTLGDLALILRARGRLEEAMHLLAEQEAICRELGNKRGLGVSLSYQALILRSLGQFDRALALHKEEEAVWRELGSPDGLAASLANQAHLLGLSMGRRNEALPLAEEAYRLASEHGLTVVAQQVRQVLDRLR